MATKKELEALLVESHELLGEWVSRAEGHMLMVEELQSRLCVRLSNFIRRIINALRGAKVTE